MSFVETKRDTQPYKRWRAGHEICWSLVWPRHHPRSDRRCIQIDRSRNVWSCYPTRRRNCPRSWSAKTRDSNIANSPCNPTRCTGPNIPIDSLDETVEEIAHRCRRRSGGVSWRTHDDNGSSFVWNPRTFDHPER